MNQFLYGQFIDEPIYTIHQLKGKTYHLLAEFTVDDIPNLLNVFKDFPNIIKWLNKLLTK